MSTGDATTQLPPQKNLTIPGTTSLVTCIISLYIFPFPKTSLLNQRGCLYLRFASFFPPKFWILWRAVFWCHRPQTKGNAMGAKWVLFPRKNPRLIYLDFKTVCSRMFFHCLFYSSHARFTVHVAQNGWQTDKNFFQNFSTLCFTQNEPRIFPLKTIPIYFAHLSRSCVVFFFFARFNNFRDETAIVFRLYRAGMPFSTSIGEC